ncbi:IS66 family transposase, partial [Thiolapillus sp.]
MSACWRDCWWTYHLPLYRQHQRLKDAGITLSRSTLTNYV